MIEHKMINERTLEYTDIAGNIARLFYEELDKIVLENMPIEILQKLRDGVLEELERRDA